MQFEELDMAEHACNLNTLEVGARGSGVQSHPQLQVQGWGGVGGCTGDPNKQTNKQANVNHGAIKPTQQKQGLAAAKQGKRSSILGTDAKGKGEN